MKTSDIFSRAYNNIKRNKARSKRTIISISIGVCSVLIMISLNIGASKATDKIKGEGNEILKIEVSGVIIAGENSIFPSMQGTAIRSLNNSDIINLHNNFSDNISYSYTKCLLDSRYVGSLEEYSFITNVAAVNYDALSKSKFEYYQGGIIKDINGAIVSRSFITHALLTKDREIGKNDLKSADVVGKEMLFSFFIVNNENGKREVKVIKLPVRIDGVLEDDNKIFGDIGGVGDNSDPNTIYDDSVIYIPLERIESLESRNAGSGLIRERRVALYVNSMDNVEKVLSKLKESNYSIISKYDEYFLIKCLVFTLKLIFGTLGILILSVSAIGIINTMLMSVLKRRKEIGIYKAIGINLNQLKRMVIYEANLLGLFGGIIGSILTIILTLLLNLFLNLNKGLITSGGSSLKILEIHWTLMAAGILACILISIFASIPSLLYVDRIDVTMALKDN